jgi:sodium-dependent phosphate transporter
MPPSLTPQGINWRFLGLQFGSWIFTLFVSGLGTAALFAQGVYAPGKIEGAQVIYYENQVSDHCGTRG